MIGWAIQTLIYIQVKVYTPESTCAVRKGSYNVSNGPWLVNTQWRFTGQHTHTHTQVCEYAHTQSLEQLKLKSNMQRVAAQEDKE